MWKQGREFYKKWPARIREFAPTFFFFLWKYTSHKMMTKAKACVLLLLGALPRLAWAYTPLRTTPRALGSSLAGYREDGSRRWGLVVMSKASAEGGAPAPNEPASSMAGSVSVDTTQSMTTASREGIAKLVRLILRQMSMVHGGGEEGAVGPRLRAEIHVCICATALFVVPFSMRVW